MEGWQQIVVDFLPNMLYSCNIHPIGNSCEGNLCRMSNIQTEVVHVDTVQPETTIIERAAALIRAGEVVVFPTETVYGLGANALQTQAVERIFEAKGRPFSDPLIVHIADERALQDLVSFIPAQVERLIGMFWPGPLTLI